MIAQTLAMVQACREAGIAVNWHRRFCPSMSEMMEVDAEWAERERRATVASFAPLVRLKRRIKASIHTLINLL